MSAFAHYSGPSGDSTRTISVTSGKGGVGKTTLVANWAYHLGQQGKSVLILDGDLSMANVNIMFGVRPAKTMQHVLWGEADIEDVLVKVASNVYLIPGGSGILELQKMTDIERQNLLDRIGHLQMDFDYLLIDTAPGIDENVLYLNSAAQEICVVLTPDPSSMADAYALIKVLNARFKDDRFNIICNQVVDEDEGLSLFKRLSDVASKFLYVSLDYKGSIPADPNLKHATKSQQLILHSKPLSPSSRAISTLIEKISHYQRVDHVKGGVQFFWEHLFGVA